jgi:hypothetical protein
VLEFHGDAVLAGLLPDQAGVPFDGDSELFGAHAQQRDRLPLRDAQVQGERGVHGRHVHLGQCCGALVEVQRVQRDASFDGGLGQPEIV